MVEILLGAPSLTLLFQEFCRILKGVCLFFFLEGDELALIYSSGIKRQQPDYSVTNRAVKLEVC